MLREVATGATAGAVGTTALNYTSYLDMLLRGRPPSEMPAEVARELSDRMGLELRMEGEASEKQEHRESAFGAMLGIETGILVGALYGPIRERLPDKTIPFAGIGVGAIAMALSNIPQITMGLTDPKEWSFADWLADVLPHLAYGFATVGALEAMRRKEIVTLTKKETKKAFRRLFA
jgi:hypothetical protein